MSTVYNPVDYAFNSLAAKKYGINGAMILNRIIWSINIHSQREDERFFIDGKWWMYDTYMSITKHFKGFMARNTVRDKIRQFEEDGLLESDQKEKNLGQMRKWYCLNESAWHKLINPQPQGKVDGTPTGTPTGTPNGTPTGTPNGTRTGTPSGMPHGTPSGMAHGTPSGMAHGTPSGTPTGPSLLNSHDLNSHDLNSQPNSQRRKVAEVETSPTPPDSTAPVKNKFTSQELELAREWLNFSLEEIPSKTGDRKYTPEAFAKEIKACKKFMGFSEGGPEMLLVFQFIRNDPFWRQNAASIYGLRKSRPDKDLRKIQTIWGQIKPKIDQFQEKRKEEQEIADFVAEMEAGSKNG